MDKLLYRPREAAAVLGISKTVLYGLIRTNRIRSIKDGKFRFITADALRDYVRQLESQAEEMHPTTQEDEGSSSGSSC
jgi:excisionase family DNA binding protein